MSREETVVKTLVFAGTVLTALAISGPATSGMLDPAPAYPVKSPDQPPVHDWTGFYVGLSGGATWGTAKWESDPDLTSGTVPGSSGIIGGTMGYNAQNWGRLVVGEEFDFSYRKYNFTIPAATCMQNCELKSDWVSTARLRFGYAIDRFMPYATGGISIGSFTADIVGQPLGVNNNVTFNWTAGAGLEYAISGPWTGKFEYLYVNHTRFGCVVECNGPVNMSVGENILRVGLNYKLWGQ
jgi:outer membrane immunogenic protein